MLRDMEQLVISIKDYEIRNYMAEALKCYYSGSYRACVILSVVAGMYDLLDKVKTLASSVPEARNLSNQIDDKIKEQNVFEQDLIDGAKSVGIISPPEHKALLGYKDTRNSCAHPGGHQSSPEEARNVFSGIYDILLSKPARIGANYRKELLEKIKSDVFCPDPKDIATVAEKHFNIIHSYALPVICRELIKVITNQEAEKLERSNASLLLSGFILLTDEDTKTKIQGHMSELLDRDDTFPYVIKMLEGNMDVLRLFDNGDRKRIITRFKQRKMDYEIFNSMYSIYRSKILDDQDRLEILSHILQDKEVSPIALSLIFMSEEHDNYPDSTECQQIIRGLYQVIERINPDDWANRLVLSRWMGSVEKLNSPDLDQVYIEKLIQFIGHSDYYHSNFGTELLTELSGSLIERVPEEIKISLALSVLSAARMNAREAQKMVSNGYRERKELVSVLTNHITENNLNEIYGKLRFADYLIKFFVNTNQLDVLEACLSQLTIDNGFGVFDFIDFSDELKRHAILDDKRSELDALIEELESQK